MPENVLTDFNRQAEEVDRIISGLLRALKKTPPK
jgi:hypothetical protein